MRRALLLAAALTIPVAGATVAMAPAAFAGAKITCTTIHGTEAGTLVVSGCSGGNTGGSSQPIVTTALATGGTITWSSGSSTTISAPQITPEKSAKKCPGYVKGTKKNPYTGAEPTADKFTATVTADSGDGIKVPGKASGAVCISQSGSVTALKSLKTN